MSSTDEVAHVVTLLQSLTDLPVVVTQTEFNIAIEQASLGDSDGHTALPAPWLDNFTKHVRTVLAGVDSSHSDDSENDVWEVLRNAGVCGKLRAVVVSQLASLSSPTVSHSAVAAATAYLTTCTLPGSAAHGIFRAMPFLKCMKVMATAVEALGNKRVDEDGAEGASNGANNEADADMAMEAPSAARIPVDINSLRAVVRLAEAVAALLGGPGLQRFGAAAADAIRAVASIFLQPLDFSAVQGSRVGVDEAAQRLLGAMKTCLVVLLQPRHGSPVAAARRVLQLVLKPLCRSAPTRRLGGNAVKAAAARAFELVDAVADLATEPIEASADGGGAVGQDADADVDVNAGAGAGPGDDDGDSVGGETSLAVPATSSAPRDVSPMQLVAGIHDALRALAQHVCVTVGDRANAHAQSAAVVARVLALVPGAARAVFTRFLHTLARTKKANYRAFSCTVATQILLRTDLWKDIPFGAAAAVHTHTHGDDGPDGLGDTVMEGDGSTRDCCETAGSFASPPPGSPSGVNPARAMPQPAEAIHDRRPAVLQLLDVILRRCSDKVPTVRARALACMATILAPEGSDPLRQLLPSLLLQLCHEHVALSAAGGDGDANATMFVIPTGSGLNVSMRSCASQTTAHAHPATTPRRPTLQLSALSLSTPSPRLGATPAAAAAALHRGPAVSPSSGAVSQSAFMALLLRRLGDTKPGVRKFALQCLAALALNVACYRDLTTLDMGASTFGEAVPPSSTLARLAGSSQFGPIKVVRVVCAVECCSTCTRSPPYQKEWAALLAPCSCWPGMVECEPRLICGCGCGVACVHVCLCQQRPSSALGNTGLRLISARCGDVSVSVRKAAVIAISALFAAEPWDHALQTLWLASVVPLTQDVESSVQVGGWAVCLCSFICFFMLRHTLITNCPS